MTNIKSNQTTLLRYIDYAARAQNYFTTFSTPIHLAPGDIPPCKCGPRGVWHYFTFASVPVLNAAEHAVAYAASLREHARLGRIIYPPTEAPTESIPFSFVHAVLQTLLNDPNRPLYDHTGQITGYCRRNGYAIEPYNGRFGRGYRVHYPSAKASPGRHQVEYYIYTKETQS